MRPHRPPAFVTHDVPLAPLTTFGIGGSARYFARCEGVAQAVEAWGWARSEGLPVFVLGGGSNLLVSDAGYSGLVMVLGGTGVSVGPGVTAECVTLCADAGAPWEAVVEAAVAAGVGGVECLTGIPGTAGAAPIQNIGAYGQEVADTLAHVQALDTTTGALVTFTAADCAFGYRDSRFKRAPAGHIVLEIALRLPVGARPCLRYPEVERAVGARAATATLADVRAAIRGLRRSKGMLLDTLPNEASDAGPPSDLRSAGSFFVNPTVDASAVARLPPDAPRHPQPDGRFKLAAAWLISNAGIPRGFRRGAAAVSSRHALALTNLGGATADDVLHLAAWIRRAVRGRFGVTLVPEPVLLGFGAGATELLDVVESTLSADL